MKKKMVSMLLAASVVLSFAACGSKATKTAGDVKDAAEDAKEDTKDENTGDNTEAAAVSLDGVSLSVTTTFAGEDSNAQNYKDGIASFEEAAGVKINDSSATSDETFKARVEADFQTGSEPDVLFFFSGADADSFVKEGKVVSIADIREEYPDYAGNMNDDLLPASTADGKKYVVPENGYWEAMFVNTVVLEDAGVEMPGPDYTWDQFMEDCQKIKDAGYTPIAASLGEIPHYWWEFAIFNNTTKDTHLEIPASVEEGNGPAWVQGMEDIKELYEKGFFPENTLSATDAEMLPLFTEDKAAFIIDGHWKVGGIVAACQSDPEDPSTLDTTKLDKFDVTYVPAKADSDRKASDLIGGISMGWYITTKAWEDDVKREAAVQFVQHMTTDEMVAKFALHSASALKEAPKVEPSEFNMLQIKALDMVAGTTSYTAAAQDLFNGECRVSTFDGMGDIVTGAVSASDAVARGLEIYASQQK